MKATFQKYTLQFKRPAGTSRGVLTEKPTWLLTIEHNGRCGIGECSPLPGLSIDDISDYERSKLLWTCAHISLGKEALWEQLKSYPSIQFGVEQAFLSLEAEQEGVLFPSPFTEGQVPIPINGLIWMGDKHYMQQQIREKLSQGFHCIKMKIGAIDFETEYQLLKNIRQEYAPSDIELRVDANGAFSPLEALEKLKRLSDLDEELIGVACPERKKEILQWIRPAYIILKPSLIGGYRGSEEWIDLAEKQGIGWWVTSALEGNVGLSAIAQWTYTLKNPLPQGLGTGSLYTNNFPSPLEVKNGGLWWLK